MAEGSNGSLRLVVQVLVGVIGTAILSAVSFAGVELYHHLTGPGHALTVQRLEVIEKRLDRLERTCQIRRPSAD